jgi:integrase
MELRQSIEPVGVVANQGCRSWLAGQRSVSTALLLEWLERCPGQKWQCPWSLLPRARPRQQLAAGEAWQGSGRVFTREDGSAHHPQWITKRFERLAFDAGVPPIRLHDTRHGAACLAHVSGASMKAIQALLRHA